MQVLNSQVGGSHYKNMAIQPIVFITAIKAPFIEGSIIKYVSRYKNKNGVEDLKKCIHFAKLATELNKQKHYFKAYVKLLRAYCAANEMNDLQYSILKNTLLNDWKAVEFYTMELIQKEYPENKEL